MAAVAQREAGEGGEEEALEAASSFGRLEWMLRERESHEFVLHDVVEQGDLEVLKVLFGEGQEEEEEEGEGGKGDQGASKKKKKGKAGDEGGDVSSSSSSDDSSDASEDEEAAEWHRRQQMPGYQQLFRRDKFGCTPLHVALQSRHLDIALYLLEKGAQLSSKCEGSTALHVALAAASLPEHAGFAAPAAAALIPRGIDPNAKDEMGNTALHLCAWFDLQEAARVVLETAKPVPEHLQEKEGKTEIRADVSLRDRMGNRPLHLAARFGHTAILDLILSHGGAKHVRATNMYGDTALHLAALHGRWECCERLARADATLADIKNGVGKVPLHLAQARRVAISDSVRELLTPADSGGTGASAAAAAVAAAAATATATATDQASGAEGNAAQTLVMTHDLCFDHCTCPPITRISPDHPPENVMRLVNLLDTSQGFLHTREFTEQLSFADDASQAEWADILRVHDWGYVKRIRDVCTRLSPTDPEAIGHLDADTAISYKSFMAARYAAGAVMNAVDRVVSGAHRNAFCAVRPPGHHAGLRGLVKAANDPSGGSHGFCLLNNVAIAAAYARYEYRNLGVSRIAIVDFDVHHGNGTEDIVRGLAPRIEQAAVATPFATGVMQTPVWKPWLNEHDADNVLFFSVHGFGGRAPGVPAATGGFFYPGSGPTELPDVDDDDDNNNDFALGDVQQKQSAQEQDVEDDEDEDEDEDAAEDDGKSGGGKASVAQQNPLAMLVEGEEEDDDDDSSDEDYVDQGSLSGGDSDEDAADEVAAAAAARMLSAAAADGDDGSSDMSANDRLGDTTTSYGKLKPHPLVANIGVNLPTRDPQADDAIPGMYRKRWRDYLRNEVFSRLDTFEPDLILISAGFDAHRKDEINCGYIALLEEDYEWVTSNLVKIANKCCDGRVVSVLEGGYRIEGGLVSAFSRSVGAHVRALADGSASREVYESKEAEAESQYEDNYLRERERRRQAALQRERERRLEQQRLREAARQAAATAAADSSSGPSLAASAAVASEGNGHAAAPAIGRSNDDGDSAGGKKRRRRASANVDYVALSKQLDQERKQQKKSRTQG